MRATPTRRASARRAFTLVEAVAAMTIISALGSVTSALIYTGIRSYSSAYTSAQLHEEISTALDRISRRIRDIELDSTAPSGTIAPKISSIGTSTISFSGNSTIALSGSTITFVDAGAAAVTLLTDVTAFNVRCHDESNALIATSSSGAACYPIRRVHLSITCTRNGVSEMVRTYVFIRSTVRGAAP